MNVHFAWLVVRVVLAAGTALITAMLVAICVSLVVSIVSDAVVAVAFPSASLAVLIVGLNLVETAPLMVDVQSACVVDSMGVSDSTEASGLSASDLTELASTSSIVDSLS